MPKTDETIHDTEALQSPPLTPNAETLAAIDEIENGRNLSQPFDNLADLMDSLNA